jgi:predicted dehydrogenase
MKVGVIGCGFIATEVHLPILSSHPLVESISISDVDPSRLHFIGTKFAVPHERQFPDYKKMLDVEVVFILTPPHLHTQMILDCLDKGKHVFVEKPMCLYSGEAEKIVLKADETGLSVYVGYNLRFMPQIKLAKQLLNEGKIGKPVFISVNYLADDVYTRSISPDSFYLSKEKGGGVLNDAFCHIVDLATWTIGNNIIDIKGALDDSQVDRTAAAVIKFENGLIGTLRALWAPLSNFLPNRRLKVMEIIGTGGYLITELYAGSISIHRKGKGVQTIMPQNANVNNPTWALNKSYRDQDTFFLESIKESRKISADARYSAYITRLIESIRSNQGLGVRDQLPLQ